ncbi:MAG: hypothetical protein GY791_12725 [Alphaproteobacteria bacterium]|nr:hypothetical protein [Alphaproteobacteria bacterium]
MSGDYSRKRFDPGNDFAGVLMQQGRVQLDADWNEQTELLDRRWRAETVDIVGRCGYPKETPDGFRIINNGGSLEIGPGRMYVDGLLAENHGGGIVEFDRILAEERGTEATPFSPQLYQPDVDTDDLDSGRHLVYLDVWQREVTYLEDDGLVEVAVGVDTTTRLQTAWQVKIHADIGDDVTCATPPEEIPDWLDVIAPSGGRLSTTEVDVPGEENPCLVPPTGGYKGLENRLYRVEIHDGSETGAPTFKWSRTNGTVASTVTGIATLDTLHVVRTNRDSVLRFNNGDWVEISDDNLEFADGPGIIRQIDVVDDADQTITLTEDLPAGLFPVNAQDQTDPERHTRVRRWDQSGAVSDTDGAELVDLDALGATGVIPVPAAGTSIILEDGVQITFDSAPTDRLRSGDFWVFAARTADATVEHLEIAPPCGIHHHFCRLAVVDYDGEEFEGEPLDCRVCFPQGGTGCCTVVVHPGESIQAALDSLPDEGGCVCLKPGIHDIDSTIRIERSNVMLHGESSGAVVRRSNGVTLLRVLDPLGTRLTDTTIERIQFRYEGGSNTDPELFAIVSLGNGERTALRHCGVSSTNFLPIAAVRIASGFGVEVSDCTLGNTFNGVWVDTDSTDLRILDNVVSGGIVQNTEAGNTGILLEDAFGDSRVERNEISGFVMGIVLANDPFAEFPFSLASGSLIQGNRIERVATMEPTGDVKAFGIFVAASACRILDNRLSYSSAAYGGISASGTNCAIEHNWLTYVPAGQQGEDRPLAIQVGLDADNAVGHGDGATVANNRLAGPQDGILIQQCMDAEIVENRLESAGDPVRFGITLSQVTHGRVAANRLVNAQAAINLNEGERNSVEANILAGGLAGISAVGQQALTIDRNRIESLDWWGVLGAQLEGTTMISRNRIVSCGSASTPFGALGIGLVFALGEVQIESCEIINTGISADGTQTAPLATGIWGFVVLECRIEGNEVTYSDMTSGFDPNQEHRALRILGYLEYTSGEFAFGFPAQVLNNKFIGPGRSALVEFHEFALGQTFAVRFERVFFSNNYCFHLGGQAGAQAATVRLTGRRAVVMGNQIKALAQINSVDFGSTRGVFIGNITRGGATQLVDFPTPEGDFNLTAV